MNAGFDDLRRLSATQALRITRLLRSQKELEGDELIVAGKHNSDRAVLVKCYVASSVGHGLQCQAHAEKACAGDCSGSLQFFIWLELS